MEKKQVFNKKQLFIVVAQRTMVTVSTDRTLERCPSAITRIAAVAINACSVVQARIACTFTDASQGYAWKIIEV